MTHSEKAVELFEKGYNCAQAVFGAFAEDVGIDETTALKMAAPFGGGVGRMREICGACSGMLMAFGIEEGYATPETGETKAAHYEMVRQLLAEFVEQNGSFICRDILKINESGGDPSPRTDAYYHERPCARCVRTAAEILDRHKNGEI